MPAPRADPDDPLIANAFQVICTQPLDGGGGQAAFAVRDHRLGRTDLMAVQVAAGTAARAIPVASLAGTLIDNCLAPLAHGAGRGPGGGQACYVVTPRPPGAALAAALHGAGPGGSFTPWSERELIEQLLRPAAHVLDRLSSAGITHRAIRPNNLFRAGPGQPVTLGCAWAGPPAWLQPAVFEPPYAAFCHRAGRGEGAIADDVYALGVMLLMLAGGRLPMAAMDDDAIIRCKLERGSFAALASDLRLPSGIADLARGMLAEDPDHRPPPVLLADPLAARARRVAARPMPRAQRPLEVGGRPIWDARCLGHALATNAEQGQRLLRGQSIESWLRRSLGDPLLAARIEETVRNRAADHPLDPGRANALLVMQAAAILDPLAPMCWPDLVLFPDAIGALLAASGGPPDPSRADPPGLDQTQSIETIVQIEAAVLWADARQARIDPELTRLDARQQRLLLRIGGWSGGLVRLRYALNPLLACRSPLVGSDCVVRLADLLPALERHVAPADTVIDREIAGFISARFVGRMDAEFATLAQPEESPMDPPGQRGLAQLRVLARLAAPEPAATWPHLCKVALQPARSVLRRWRSSKARAAREAALEAAAGRGSLAAMLALLDDEKALADDARAGQHAQVKLAGIEAELARLVARHSARQARARTTGQEVAASIGMMALAAAAIATALP